MRWLGAIVCGALGVGCNWSFGLHDTGLRGPDATIDAPGCSGEPFVGPIPIPELDNAVSSPSSPSLLDGGLELWLAGREAGNLGLDLFVADRPAVGMPFGAPQAVPSLDVVGSDDAAPRFSADGLDLIFLSTRLSNGARAWETTRASTADAFPAPHQVPELGNLSLSNGLDLSRDGLAFYYVDGATFELYVVTRPTRASPFDVTNPRLVASNVQYPSVSPDQLELFFDPPQTNTIARRTRTSVDAGWDQPDELIQGTARTPHLSPDSKTLVFATSSGVAIETRACP